jgi:hypothetical protein
LDIEGDFEADTWSFVRIDFSACVNTTKKTNCRPKDEINKIIGKSYIASYFTNNILDPKKPNNPFKIIGESRFWANSLNI